MYHARKLPVSILVLAALAILLSFLLTPQIRSLERCGLPRGLAVGPTALVFFFFFAVVSWITARQISSLAASIPVYQGNIQSKLEALHGKGGPFRNAAAVLAKANKRAGDPATSVVKPGDRPSVPTTHQGRVAPSNRRWGCASRTLRRVHRNSYAISSGRRWRRWAWRVLSSLRCGA